MAHILPDTLPQVLPAEVHRTFRALKELPETWFVWHHLAPWQPDAPDFLLVTKEGRALLVKVSPASSTDASPAQLLLIQDARTPMGKAEEEVLRRFLQAARLAADQPLGILVFFPNIAHRQVLNSRPNTDIAWAGKELLQGDTGMGWETFLPERPMDSLQLEKLRHAFTPEAVVTAEMTVRPADVRRTAAGLADYLLDYNQEAAVKADLDLDPDGQALTSDFRLNIINGVAGSGKTLILLYRLRLLYHLYPGKRFLVLTHNRPLIHDMQNRFARLEGTLPETIAWHTFNSWCYHHWPKVPRWVEPLKLPARQRLLHAVWQQQFGGPDSGRSIGKPAVTERMLASEIDWIKDQLPMDQAAYGQADRRGRGFRLTAEQREGVYQALEAYQNALAVQHALDWGDVPQQIWRFEQEGRVIFPQYDILLVDEAQFFAPLWIAIIQKLLKPQTGHLFIVADPTQGFLGRGASWKSLGLQARGRSQQLRRSYRTTREILQFASLFYRLRLPEEQDEEILAPDLLQMPTGAFPEMIALRGAQDEVRVVADTITEFIRKGHSRRHLLVLHTNGQGVRSLKEALNYSLGKNAAMDPKDTYPGDYIRVTTLNAGAGLESPIVFLVGLRELFEEEQSLRLSDEEREMLIQENTRKIYMAVTRAGQRLVFTYVGELPMVLKKLFASREQAGD